MRRGRRDPQLHRSPRRVVPILCVALLALFLAACGASDPPPTNPFEPGDSEPTLPPGVETGTPPPLGTPTPDDPENPATPAGTAAVPLDEEQAAAIAIEAMAGWLAVPASDLALASVEPVEWPDACLDVYRPGVACAEVVTRGMRVELETLLRASVHVVHVAGPGQLAWVPDRAVEGELVAFDPVAGALTVRTAEGEETWRVAPGSTIEPPPPELAPGTPVRAALDGIVDAEEPAEVVVWLLERPQS